MNETMLTPTLKANIEALKKVFFHPTDPRYNGENPACRELEIAIEAELDTWPDAKLKAFGDSIEGEAMDFLFGALCDLSDTRTVLKPKFD